MSRISPHPLIVTTFTRKWLNQQGYEASSKAEASRDELYSSVVSVYSVASCSAASGGSWAGSSVSSAGTEATDSAYSAGSKATDAAYSAGSKATDSMHSAGSKATDAAYSAGTKATDAAYHAGTKATDAATDAAGQAYASITSALAKATDSAKDVTFDTWSDSELKAYLDRYGINTYQGSTRNELIAAVRRNSHAFRYGSGDHGLYGQTKAMCWQMYSRVACGLGWVRDRFYGLLGFSAKKAEAAGDRVYEAGQKAGDRAYESGQKVYDRTKEKATEAKNRVKEEL